MYPWRRWPRAEAVIAALLLAVWPAASRADDVAPAGQIAERATGPSVAARGEQTLLLAVTLNGTVLPDPLLVRLEGQHIWLRASDLHALGLRRVDTDHDADLSAMPDLTVAIDRAAQTITIEDRRVRQRLRLASADTNLGELTPNGWGAILNYDATALYAPHASTAAGTIEGIVYTPRGYAFTGVIASTGEHGGDGGVIRLDSGYTFADTRSMHRLTIGDFINSNSSLSRPVRLGGVKFGTDFSIRPDIITFPVPTINGSAALPSAVDLVVNGNRRGLGDVRAGQFSVTDIPVQTGVNSVTVAVRDALGRQTLQTVTTYASRTLLRPGLVAYSGEFGAIRTGYATEQDRYREAAGSGSIRVGISSSLTGEAHFEASRSVTMASGGFSLALGPIGLVDLSAAASRSNRSMGGSGQQFGIGFERIARPISLSVRYTMATKGFADLASRYGAMMRRHSLVANIGFDLGRFGTLGLTTLDLGRGRAITDGNGELLPFDYGRADRSRLVDASYSVRVVDRINLVANFGSDLRQRRSTFASLGALVVFGPRSSGYVGASVRSGGASGNAEFVRNAIEPGQWGYRASAAVGVVDRLAAGVEYLGQHGHVEAQVEQTNGDFAARASARGSLVIAGGHLFTSDTVTGSFAVVDTNGQRDVTIYRDHRRIGETDRAGRLLVPNLTGFQSTTFSIDPTQIAPEIAVANSEASVRPLERTGVKVSFDLRANDAAIVSLVDAAGDPIPAGSRALVAGQDLPVGIGGEVYLTRLSVADSAAVHLPDGQSCTATFPRPIRSGPVTRLGPIYCMADGAARSP